MKHAHACAALILTMAFTGGCATRPPASEAPYLVQLSATYSDGPCDWSLMQNVNDRSKLNGPLGATYWPHAVPAASRSIEKRSAPLGAYGTDTVFSWPSQPNQSLCLALYKRASVWHENVPPLLTLEISQAPRGARIHALTSNAALASAVVTLKSAGSDADLPTERIDLALRGGRAEGDFAQPPDASWVGVIVVATEIGGEGQIERALELLSTAGPEENLIERDGSRLVARPSWPPRRP